jgi:hypothetical protein
MHSAEFYGIHELRESCTAFFQQALSAEVYYELLDLAMSIRCERAQQLCIRALAKDFSTAIDHAAFSRISVESLKGVLQDEALCVANEEEVLRALVAWLEVNRPAKPAAAADRGDPPAADVDALLKLVRWPWLSTSALCGVQERHPCLSERPSLDRLLLQAFRFHALGAEQRAAMASESTQYQPRPVRPRRS